MQDLPLYNSKIVKVFDEYIRKNHPDVDMASVLEYAGITTYQMEDEGHWFTQTQMDRFYEIIVKNSRVADLARKVGQYMPLAESAGAISQYTLGFMTPATAYVMLGKLYPRISQSVKVETGKIGAHQSQVIITQKPGVKEKPYQCENRIGVFEGVAKLFANKLARVDHPICMHKSGDRCVYNIQWEEASSNTWKRIVRYSSLFAVITSIILFFFLPFPYSAVAILLLLCFIMGAYCYQIFLEKNELKISLKNHGNMANDLLNEIDTRYNSAMLIQEIGQASSHIMNVDKLLQLILGVIEKRLTFDRGLIMLADQNRTHLTYQAGFGYSEEEESSLSHMLFLLDAPDPNDPFITSFLQQKPFLVKDGQEIEKIIATGNRTYAKQMRFKSLLCVPIVYEGKAEGIIAVDNHLSSTQMKQSDVNLLSGIAHQISISIHNAKTYQLVLESEERLIQSQKMESVGRLAGGVAHDFNNMLSVIIGNTEMAMKRVNHSDPIHKSLQAILNAGTRSADLTRQLLAFARKQTINPKVLDLNDTVSSMLKMLRRLIGEDIELIWKPGPRLWKVKIDPSQIDQILANLTVNARDAIEKTGQVTIETANTVCDASYCKDRSDCIPGKYVILTVKDNGCGMEKQTLANIFEPFFTTKKEGQGTGLGLATVYGISKQNNGFIDVESEPGLGTTFRIYLPRNTDEGVGTEDEEEKPETQGGTETVLIVEDEPTVLNLIKSMLEMLGYTVLTASGKDQALKLVYDDNGKIDMLLTDVVMPGMNGKELAERILEVKPGLKCLYMSGYTADVIARQEILDEGIKFISKPFSLQDLAVKVREVLG